MTNPSAPTDVLNRFTVNRSSPVPLYFQVAEFLESIIENGELPPGTTFENEILLADQLGLSRPTMRRAMQYLVDKGLIVRRRGVGTRVVQPKVRRPLELSSLYDDLQRSGQEPTTEVLGFEPIAADDDLAIKLACPVGTDLVRIIRLRSAAGKPISRMMNYLPANLIPFTAEALESRGLYDLIRSQGITLHSASQTLGARNATAPESRLLGEPKGAALLTMERITYDDHGAVVEYGTHIYAASRYSFEVNLLSP